KKGRVIVVAHRIHEADLSADLLESGEWSHLALPLIAPKTQTYRTRYGKWKRRKGTLLRPDAEERASVKRRRDKSGNSKFELLDQQCAGSYRLPRVRAKNFSYFDEEEVRELPHFISVDPGTSATKGQSFSVAQVWATDGQNHYLVDQAKNRWDFEDL